MFTTRLLINLTRQLFIHRQLITTTCFTISFKHDLIIITSLARVYKNRVRKQQIKKAITVCVLRNLVYVTHCKINEFCQKKTAHWLVLTSLLLAVNGKCFIIIDCLLGWTCNVFFWLNRCAKKKNVSAPGNNSYSWRYTFVFQRRTTIIKTLSFISYFIKAIKELTST